MKSDKYISALQAIECLENNHVDLIALMANISAILKETFSFLWCGFYIVKGQQLVLGPFQGHVACSRISYGKGVCGKSFETKQALIVKDVNQFDGYISCSSSAKSEIVIPILKDDNVLAVIDVDSELYAHFDEIDLKYLTKISVLISKYFN